MNHKFLNIIDEVGNVPDNIPDMPIIVPPNIIIPEQDTDWIAGKIRNGLLYRSC